MHQTHSPEPRGAGPDWSPKIHRVVWYRRQLHPVHPERTLSRSSSGYRKTESFSFSASGETRGWEIGEHGSECKVKTRDFCLILQMSQHLSLQIWLFITEQTCTMIHKSHSQTYRQEYVAVTLIKASICFLRNWYQLHFLLYVEKKVLLLCPPETSTFQISKTVKMCAVQ